MSRLFVKDLGEQQQIEQVFLVASKQLRSNRQGSLYLQLQLCDKTGVIDARMWNATEAHAAAFEDGDYVRAKGTTQLYQGAIQLIATRISKIPNEDVDETEYQRLTQINVDGLRSRLVEILGTISDPGLNRLAGSFYQDESFMAKFCQAPAGIKHHHAHKGGLLQHVVQLLEVIDRICELYPSLNRDLMLVGAFLHDSGKVDELGYQRELHYTDEGQLLGHIVIAISMLDQKLAEMSDPALPDELVLLVKHLIVSHHGSTEFGSPTVPMTVEAVALNLLDNFDAKINHIEQLLRDDANVNSRWTQYHPNLGRKLFKGGRPEGETAG
ncbi:MAG: HD domain-containing protein [Planctomycetales bacterium]